MARSQPSVVAVTPVGVNGAAATAADTVVGVRAIEEDVLVPQLADTVDVDELETLWTVVTKAGGAVGFVPDSPQSHVRVEAEETAAAIASGEMLACVVRDGGALVGMVCLRPRRGERFVHCGDVIRLMLHPRWQGRGLGPALLAAAVEQARELGLELLMLSARGGTELPAWYRRLGWTEVGVFPGVLRLGPGDDRAEHWFQLRL